MTGLNEWLPEATRLYNITNFTDHELTGSANIVGKGQDFDVVLLVQDIYNVGMQLSLILDGWKKLGAEESYGDDGMFISYRKGNLNIITCDNPEYFEQWRIAKTVCKHLHEKFGLSTKEVRVAMHQIIVDGCV